jgi:hypothetical protein
MRTCSKCSEEKELNEFSIRITSKDGYNRKCKKCVTETKWLWAQKNKDKVKKSRENRKDSIKESKKKWYDANPELPGSTATTQSIRCTGATRSRRVQLI